MEVEFESPKKTAESYIVNKGLIFEDFAVETILKG
jgi:hypothetical protein